LRVDLRVDPVNTSGERGPQSNAVESRFAFVRGGEAVGVEVSADGVAVGEEEGVLREAIMRERSAVRSTRCKGSLSMDMY
jgi:hypothetical protein